MSKFIKIASKDNHLHLGLCPSVGGSIVSFFADAGGDKKIHLFRPYNTSLPLSPLNFASFPLTPFSNRIGYGKLAFHGKTYDVGPPFGGEKHPNHGDGWTSPWVVKEHGPSRAVLTLKTAPRADTPYVYEAEQVFTISNDKLEIDMMVKNLSKDELPFGVGHHPYFVRTDKTVLKLKAPKVWLSNNMVPEKLVDVPAKWNFTKGITLAPQNLAPPEHGGDGTAYIDHCFAGWNQMAEVMWPEIRRKLVIKADPAFQHFVVYVPSKSDFFCAEPVTNATDGFNLMEKGVANTGTVTLEPGQSLSGRMTFEFATM